MTHKTMKKFRNFMFSSAGRSLVRSEGVSGSLDVLNVPLEAQGEINKYRFFSSEKVIFRDVNFTIFVHQTLDPDPHCE